MSHDDIRAALEAATIIEAPGYMVRADGLAELLAEVDNARRELGDVHVSLYSEIAMLTARAKAAEQVVRRVRGMAEAWATQPTDYDEDTEQQIEDGKAILRALDGGAS